MPVDLMSPEERKAFFKKSKPAPELEDVEEAPF